MRSLTVPFLPPKGNCFAKTTVTARATGNGGAEFAFAATGPARAWFCTDRYIVATPQGVATLSLSAWPVFGRRSHSVAWAPSSAADPALEAWYLASQGAKVLLLPGSVPEVLLSLLKTLLLFEPEITKKIPPGVRALNMDFLSRFAPIGPKPRKRDRLGVDVRVDVPEEWIHSGDFFGVFRPDGIDPMLAWGMGSTTGHTTVALRFPNGQGLHVCESQAKSDYWPVNGVQCTPYRQWVRQAAAAGYHVVWAPLSPEYRARFDEAKAVAFFEAAKGLDYGYRNLLWGWVDTLDSNYPCAPPDWGTTCLEWGFIEVAFGIVERLVPGVAHTLWGQAWNHRLGTFDRNLNTLQLYHEAVEGHGLQLAQLPTLVEQDGWTYNTTRNGAPERAESMVCCVFVCALWKAAGLFSEVGDEVNCTEFVNTDVYALAVFDAPENRPDMCKRADPDNPVCQLMGRYTLHLGPYYNSRPMTRHMAESCPSKPPLYHRPPGC